VEEPVAFENGFYRAVLRPDGAFSSLAVKPSRRELFDLSNGAGNTLSATDSTAVSFHEETQDERLERYVADPPVRGSDLVWRTTNPGWVRHSPLGMVFCVSGCLGDTVTAELTVRFYHQLARIDLTWDFHFDKASIGTFFDDDSKLLVRWPTAIGARIHHDIPFGVVQEREDRPFFPTSWVDLSDGESGLAFFHQGTPNHWVRDRALFNLIGWGEQTDAIHNGLGRYQWLKSFDQRLDGHHTIQHAIYPHPGDWRTADLPRAAREYGFPPAAYSTGAHPGKLPSTRTVIQLLDASIAATSVRTVDSQVVCRVYAPSGREATTRSATQGLQGAGLRLLSGEPVDGLQPFQVGDLHFNVERSE
jgi:hypothetical protein